MIFVKMERTPLNSTTSRWLGDFTFFQYNRSAPSLLSVLGLKKDHEEYIAQIGEPSEDSRSNPVPIGHWLARMQSGFEWTQYKRRRSEINGYQGTGRGGYQNTGRAVYDCV